MARRGTPTFTLRLDPEIRRQLEAICEINGISISDAVRLAILDFIEKANSEK